MNYGDQVAPVELDVSSQSSSSCRASRAVRLARHSQNAWARHVECVESSRAKWNLGLTIRMATYALLHPLWPLLLLDSPGGTCR